MYWTVTNYTGTLPLQLLDQASYAESIPAAVSNRQCGGAGVELVRGLASLLAYLVGVSAIISIGVAGLMAYSHPLNERHLHQLLRSNRIRASR